MLNMTAALRLSELFALRWKSFDSRNTLAITETVYLGVIRPFGKTKKSLGKVHLPDGLAHELLLWKAECPYSSPDAFIFPNADGGIMRVDNYRERVLIRMGDGALRFRASAIEAFINERERLSAQQSARR
jgi:integrase